MKNIVIGWLFLIAGVALLGVSLWTLRERPSQTTAAPPSASVVPSTTSPAPSSDAGEVAGISMVPSADMPAEMPAEAEPAGPEPMPAEPVDPAINPAMDPPSDPEAPMDAETEPTTDRPAETPPVPAPKEVLLVFDARSQHISQAIKDELASLARSNLKGSFRIEVFVGDRATPEENEKLGKRRARAIRKVLEDAGIPERRVSYKVILPGPADGDGEKTSRHWRKATVKPVRTGE